MQKSSVCVSYTYSVPLHSRLAHVEPGPCHGVHGAVHTTVGVRGLCKMLLAATSSCSGAFQPLPVVLLLPAMWWLFQTIPSHPVLKLFSGHFCHGKLPGYQHLELLLFSLGLCAWAQILQLLDYSWCHVLGSFDACLEQRVPVMSCGTGDRGHTEPPTSLLQHIASHTLVRVGEQHWGLPESTSGASVLADPRVQHLCKSVLCAGGPAALSP